jgi:hypothetical protein
LRGHDDKLAGDEVERPHHGDLSRPAGSLDVQVGFPFRLGAGKIRMGRRSKQSCFSGESRPADAGGAPAISDQTVMLSGAGGQRRFA